MTDVGRFGVFLPSYIWEGDGAERARGIKACARTVEELGFDSLFITDHLLAARRFYSVNWLEPLTTLAVAAGATERVRLGTSILIMPLRNPVILAKELATLQFLSDNRVILGAGVGWNDAEYEAVGVHKSERGKRTDEMLDIMMPLLEGERVTYHGQFYDVDDVFIEPRTSQRPLLWIGGGSQLADPKSPDVPEIVASLQARVDAGVEYFFLHTMTPDPAQLRMWVDEIIPKVVFPPTAGPVRRPPQPWRRETAAAAPR